MRRDHQSPHSLRQYLCSSQSNCWWRCTSPWPFSQNASNGSWNLSEIIQKPSNRIKSCVSWQKKGSYSHGAQRAKHVINDQTMFGNPLNCSLAAGIFCHVLCACFIYPPSTAKSQKHHRFSHKSLQGTGSWRYSPFLESWRSSGAAVTFLWTNWSHFFSTDLGGDWMERFPVNVRLHSAFARFESLLFPPANQLVKACLWIWQMDRKSEVQLLAESI